MKQAISKYFLLSNDKFYRIRIEIPFKIITSHYKQFTNNSFIRNN